MTNPTPEPPRDVADMPPEERERQYHAAMAAEALVRGPLPPDWPEDVRHPWGARRDLVAMLRGTHWSSGEAP